MTDKYLVGMNEEDERAWELERRDDVVFVRREGEADWKAVSLNRVGDSGLYLLMVDNRPTEIYLERRRGGARVTIGRHVFLCDVGPWRPAGSRASRHQRAAGRLQIQAPMTGSIVEVRVEAGQRVAQGDVLLVVESMKMNNELRSPGAGVVESVSAKPQQRVKQGEVLIVVDTGEGEPKGPSPAE